MRYDSQRDKRHAAPGAYRPREDDREAWGPTTRVHQTWRPPVSPPPLKRRSISQRRSSPPRQPGFHGTASSPGAASSEPHLGAPTAPAALRRTGVNVPTSQSRQSSLQKLPALRYETSHVESNTKKAFAGESSCAATRPHKTPYPEPHVFLSTEQTGVMPEHIKNIRNVFAKFRPDKVECDKYGFYVIFPSTLQGRNQAKQAARERKETRLFGKWALKAVPYNVQEPQPSQSRSNSLSTSIPPHVFATFGRSNEQQDIKSFLGSCVPWMVDGKKVQIRIQSDSHGFYFFFPDTSKGRLFANAAAETMNGKLDSTCGRVTAKYVNQSNGSSRSSSPGFAIKGSATTKDRAIHGAAPSRERRTASPVQSFEPRPLSEDVEMDESNSPVPSYEPRPLSEDLESDRLISLPEGNVAQESSDHVSFSVSKALLQNDDAASMISGTTASSRSKTPKCHVCKSLGGVLICCASEECHRRYHRHCLPSNTEWHPQNSIWQCDRCKRKNVPLKRLASQRLTVPLEVDEGEFTQTEPPQKKARVDIGNRQHLSDVSTESSSAAGTDSPQGYVKQGSKQRATNLVTQSKTPQAAASTQSSHKSLERAVVVLHNADFAPDSAESLSEAQEQPPSVMREDSSFAELNDLVDKSFTEDSQPESTVKSGKKLSLGELVKRKAPPAMQVQDQPVLQSAGAPAIRAVAPAKAVGPYSHQADASAPRAVLTTTAHALSPATGPKALSAQEGPGRLLTIPADTEPEAAQKAKPSARDVARPDTPDSAPQPIKGTKGVVKLRRTKPYYTRCSTCDKDMPVHPSGRTVCLDCKDQTSKETRPHSVKDNAAPASVQATGVNTTRLAPRHDTMSQRLEIPAKIADRPLQQVYRTTPDRPMEARSAEAGPGDDDSDGSSETTHATVTTRWWDEYKRRDKGQRIVEPGRSAPQSNETSEQLGDRSLQRRDRPATDRVLTSQSSTAGPEGDDDGSDHYIDTVQVSDAGETIPDSAASQRAQPVQNQSAHLPSETSGNHGTAPSTHTPRTQEPSPPSKESIIAQPLSTAEFLEDRELVPQPTKRAEEMASAKVPSAGTRSAQDRSAQGAPENPGRLNIDTNTQPSSELATSQRAKKSAGARGVQVAPTTLTSGASGESSTETRDQPLKDTQNHPQLPAELGTEPSDHEKEDTSHPIGLDTEPSDDMLSATREVTLHSKGSSIAQPLTTAMWRDDLPRKRRITRQSHVVPAIDQFDLGNSYKRPKSTYWRLIALALRAAPDHRATPAQIANWIAQHVPNYELGKGSWQSGIQSTMIMNQQGKSGKVLASVTTLRSDDGRDRDQKVYELLPDIARELEEWDDIEQRPIRMTGAGDEFEASVTSATATDGDYSSSTVPSVDTDITAPGSPNVDEHDVAKSSPQHSNLADQDTTLNISLIPRRGSDVSMKGVEKSSDRAQNIGYDALVDELWTEEIEQSQATTPNLYDVWQELAPKKFDKEAKIAEIATRPNRKNRDPMKDQYMDMANFIPRPAHSDLEVIRPHEAEQEEGPNSTIIVHCNSVDEFLGIADDLVPCFHERELAFKHAEGNKRVYYKTGIPQ